MKVVAPGRVNLIGDHTDYTGGLVFPIAINRSTVIEAESDDDRVTLRSSVESGVVSFDVPVEFDRSMQPRWGRYVAAIASLMPSPRGINGTISSTIPVGGGLSSSAALEIAVALAMGADPSPVDLALLAQRAERLATGVPTGIMDQLCIASAREGTGTLIDCRSLYVTHVPIPDDVEFVVRFVAHRTLEGSEYADRVSQCIEAERIVGPLRDSTVTDVARIHDDVVRARARHVVSENARVVRFVDALRAGDNAAAGMLMTESHRSLALDFAVSTSAMDDEVSRLCSMPGVFGARMTGGGFGGCVVAMCTPGTITDDAHYMRVTPAGAACVVRDPTDPDPAEG